MRDDSISLINYKKDFFKMLEAKARTATFLVMIVVTLALIFSIADAFPAEPVPSPESVNETGPLGNHSRLVITNVVKTVEFEVGILEDDGVTDDENSTATNSTGFIETDIQVLNLDLLKEVVDQAEKMAKGSTEKPETALEESEKTPEKDSYRDFKLMYTTV